MKEILESLAIEIYKNNRKKYNIQNILKRIYESDVFSVGGVFIDGYKIDNILTVQLEKFDGTTYRLEWSGTNEKGKKISRSICLIWVILAGFKEMSAEFIFHLLADEFYGRKHFIDGLLSLNTNKVSNEIKLLLIL
jgi:hypothetical protein